MCKENLYAKMEKFEAQICRCTRHGLTVMPLVLSTWTLVHELSVYMFLATNYCLFFNTILMMDCINTVQ